MPGVRLNDIGSPCALTPAAPVADVVEAAVETVPPATVTADELAESSKADQAPTPPPRPRKR